MANNEFSVILEKVGNQPLTVATPSNDDFDAIFGGSTEIKTTAPTKTKDSIKSTPKAKADKISAAPNDEFDAIFGKGK